MILRFLPDIFLALTASVALEKPRNGKVSVQVWTSTTARSWERARRLAISGLIFPVQDGMIPRSGPV